MIAPAERQPFLQQLRRVGGCGYLARKALHARIVAACKKQSLCNQCGQRNGVVKKAVGALLKIVHFEPVDIDKDPDAKAEYATAVANNKELAQLIHKCKQNLLTPLRVLEIFERIQPAVSGRMLCASYKCCRICRCSSAPTRRCTIRATCCSRG